MSMPQGMSMPQAQAAGVFAVHLVCLETANGCLAVARGKFSS